MKLQKYSYILIFCNIFLIVFFLILNIPAVEKEIIHDSLILKNEIDSIAEIIINIPDNDLKAGFNIVHLIKKNDGFVLNAAGREYKTKKEIIDRFLFLLSEKQNFLFVTDDVKQSSSFGFNADKTAQIKIFKDDKSLIGEFVFGKQNTLGSGRYIRAGGRTKIFLMPDIISPFLTLHSDFWINLQRYEIFFSGYRVQALQKDNVYIIRSAENEKNFFNLELFLKQFSCVDIFPALPLTSPHTESFILFLDNKEKIKIELTPIENGDYILSDSVSENAYIISGYTKRRILELLGKLS